MRDVILIYQIYLPTLLDVVALSDSTSSSRNCAPNGAREKTSGIQTECAAALQALVPVGVFASIQVAVAFRTLRQRPLETDVRYWPDIEAVRNDDLFDRFDRGCHD